MTARSQPEKNTSQLEVWRDLIQALEHVDIAWRPWTPEAVPSRKVAGCSDQGPGR